MSSLQPSVPISAAVVLLADAIDLFCSRDRSGMTAEQVGFDLVHLRHQSDRLEVEFSTLASEFAATDEYLASVEPAALDATVTIKPLGDMPALRALAQVCVGHGFLHLGEMELARTLVGA